ncbi:MAG: leucine-rich repeat domain-containing protein [Nanoarchaeota archaeon]|nr:leucine-rich repeat domain-containing protein [Nanoarchaeota archaeon]
MNEEQLHKNALYSLNGSIADARTQLRRQGEKELPNYVDDFEHYIIEKEGQRLLLYPTGFYECSDGNNRVAGVCLAYHKGGGFIIGGFVYDDKELLASPIKHPCHAGGEFGEIGMLMTIRNLMTYLHPNLRLSAPFQVIPHINNAVQESAMSKGFTINAFREEQESILELSLNKYLDNYLAIKKEGSDISRGLMFDILGNFVNYVNIIGEEALERLVDNVSEPVFMPILDALCDEQFTETGYPILSSFIIKSGTKILNNLLKNQPRSAVKELYKYHVTIDGELFIQFKKSENPSLNGAIKYLSLNDLINNLSNFEAKMIKKLDLNNYGEKYNNLICDGLGSIPESITRLVNLEELRLNRNPLFKFPEEILELKNLKSLMIQNININALPERIYLLSKLEDLTISNNNLKCLPESFWNLKNLKILDIVENEIKSIPESIRNLANLKQLFIGSNPLTNVPEDIGNLSKLEFISMLGLKIEAVPDSIINNFSTPAIECHWYRNDSKSLKEFNSFMIKQIKDR